MTRQKGKFLTFCFSMMPGAGHMYLGFMKQGLSLMIMFAALCAISMWLEAGPLLLFAPIIWFYSFFDVINKNSLEPEEFYELEDHFIWGTDWMNWGDIFKGSMRSKDSKKTLAIALYIVAGFMIWSVFRYFITNFFGVYGIAGAVINKLPVLVAAGVIIWIAYRMIQNENIKDEPFFGDETESDMPYPFVQPPVLHMDAKETAEAAAVKESSSDEIYAEPKSAADEDSGNGTDDVLS